jgi:hypothetical protein
VKPETLFLLAGGAALMLYFMDKQQSAAPVAAPPSPAPQPSQAPPVSVSDLATGCPQGQIRRPSPGGGPGDCVPYTYTPPPPPPVVVAPTYRQIVPRGIANPSDPLLQQPVILTQRDPGRVATNPGSISGLSLYGGWGK